MDSDPRGRHRGEHGDLRREYLASRTGLRWDLSHFIALRIIRRHYSAVRQLERTFLDRVRTRRRDWSGTEPVEPPNPIRIVVGVAVGFAGIALLFLVAAGIGAILDL